MGAGDRVIESYISSDGLTWYRKYASGWKECGIRISTGSEGVKSYTLPIAFSNTNYSVYGMVNAAGNNVFVANCVITGVQSVDIINKFFNISSSVWADATGEYSTYVFQGF